MKGILFFTLLFSLLDLGKTNFVSGAFRRGIASANEDFQTFQPIATYSFAAASLIECASFVATQKQTTGLTHGNAFQYRPQCVYGYVPYLRLCKHETTAVSINDIAAIYIDHNSQFCGCVYYESDPGGSEVALHSDIDSATACFDLCRADSGCFHWLWTFSTKECSLRADDVESEEHFLHEEGLVSGRKDCSPLNVCVDHDVDYFSGASANEIGGENSWSVLQCAKICLEESLCTHWTYRRDLKWCSLKNSTGDSTPSINAISASKFCSLRHGFLSIEGPSDAIYAGGDASFTSAWDDADDYDQHGEITEINVRSGNRVDSFQVKYGSTWAQFHGGNGGGLNTLVLSPGERIIGVTTRQGGVIDAIGFTTNMAVYPMWGGGGGGLLEVQLDRDCYVAWFSGGIQADLARLFLHTKCSLEF